MNARKVWLGVLVVILLLGLPGLALAGLSGVVYTGPLFSSYGGNYLSSQVFMTPPPAFGQAVPPFPVVFQGVTLWGALVGAGPAVCDAAGAASALGEWPPGVYRSYAVAQDYPSQVMSLENVMTVYSRYIRGIACGGEVGLGPIPTRSTVGFIYGNMNPVYIPPGTGTLAAPYANLRSFLVDINPTPESQYPAYSMWATDFKSVRLNCSNGAVMSVDIVGKCYFRQGFGAAKYVNLQARFDFASDPAQPLFSLKVWRQSLFFTEVYVNDQNRPISNGGFFVKTQ